MERLKRFLCTASLCTQITFFGSIMYNTQSSNALSDILHNYKPKVGNGFGSTSISKIIQCLHDANLTVIKIPNSVFCWLAILSLGYLIYFILDAILQNKKLSEKIDLYHMEQLDYHDSTRKLVLMGDSNGKKEKTETIQKS